MAQIDEKRRLRIGIIGFGKFGQFIASSLRASPVVEVVAVADEVGIISALEAAGFDLKAIQTDPMAILNDPTIDAVHIATPPASHASLAIAALQAGKHVVIEKPLALTPTEGEAVLAAAAQAKRIVAVCYVLRYNSILHSLRALIQQQLFGSLRDIQIENIAQRVQPDTHWFWDLKQSGGIHIEHGVHFFDAVAYVVGSSPTYTAGNLLFRETKNTDAEATTHYEGGVRASFYHGFLLEPKLELTQWTLVWDRATAVVDGWIPLRLTIEAEPTPAEKKKLLQMGFKIEDHAANQSRVTLTAPADKQAVYSDSVRALWQDVAGAIQGTTDTIVADGPAGLSSLTTAWHASQKHLSL